MYFKKSLKTYKVPVLQKDREIYSSSGEVEREKKYLPVFCLLQESSLPKSICEQAQVHVGDLWSSQEPARVSFVTTMASRGIGKPNISIRMACHLPVLVDTW